MTFSKIALEIASKAGDASKVGVLAAWIDTAIANERAECAREADYYAENSPTAKAIAKAIRRRGETV